MRQVDKLNTFRTCSLRASMHAEKIGWEQYTGSSRVVSVLFCSEDVQDVHDNN